MSKSRVADVIPKIQINMDNWRALSIVQAASIVVGFTAWARNYKMLLKELKNKTSGSALEQPGVVDCWYEAIATTTAHVERLIRPVLLLLIEKAPQYPTGVPLKDGS